jgi:SHAQKYF class myb-like DNA-binding protein
MPGNPWPVALHREFAAAVYEVGMSRSSPSIILQNMQTTDETITSERVKSHLQKYRRKQPKGKEDFLAAYDKWMTKVMTLSSGLKKRDGTADALIAQNPVSASQHRALMNPDNLGSGEMAAYLSFVIMMQENRDRADEKFWTTRLPPAALSDDNELEDPKKEHIRSYLAYDSVRYPQLTEAEKKTTLGKGLDLVQQLLSLLNEQVEAQRQLRGQQPPGEQENERSLDKSLLAQDEVAGLTRVALHSSLADSTSWSATLRKNSIDVLSDESVSPQTSRLLALVVDDAVAARISAPFLGIDDAPGAKKRPLRVQQRCSPRKRGRTTTAMEADDNYEPGASAFSITSGIDLKTAVATTILRQVGEESKQSHYNTDPIPLSGVDTLSSPLVYDLQGSV